MSTSHGPSDHSPSPSPNRGKRTVGKRFVTIIAVCLSLFILFAAFLPTLASSKWGNTQLVHLVNTKIPGTISVENISLSWLGPQSVKGLVLKDPQDKVVLSLKKGLTFSSLFQLINKDALSAGFDIESLNGMLATDAKGDTNIQRALSQQCCQLDAADAQNQAAIVFKEIHAKVDTANQRLAIIRMTGETLQNTQSGKFNIDAEIKGIGLQQLLNKSPAELDHLMQSDLAEFKVKADIVNLPVALLDQFVTLKLPEFSGLLQELFGQQLNLNISQDLTASGIHFVLNMASPNLKAEMDVELTDALVIKKPLQIEAQLTPELVKKLGSATKQTFPWRLEKKTTAKLIINQFQYPLHSLDRKSLMQMDLRELAIDATFSLQQALLSAGKSISINVQQLTATVKTESEGSQLTVGVKGSAQQNGQPFSLDVDATITKPPTLQDLLNDLPKHLKAQGEVNGLPLSLLDASLGLDGQLLGAVGSTADIGLSFLTKKITPTLTLSFKSQQVDIPVLVLSIGSEIKLSKPAIAKVSLSPGFVQKTLFAGSKEAPRLRENVSAVIKMNHLSLPNAYFGKNGSRNEDLLDRIVLEADIALSSIILTQIPTIDTLAINDFHLHIGGKSLSRALCQAKGVFSQKEKSGLLLTILGGETRLTTSASLKLQQGKSPEIDSLDLLLTSNLAKMSLAATMQGDNILRLQAPAVINYTLTSAALKAMGIHLADNLFIQHGTPLELTIAKTNFPSNMPDLSHLLLTGDLTIKDVSLSHVADRGNPSAVAQATLEAFHLNWTFNAPSGSLTFSFNGATRLKGLQERGGFSGDAHVTGLSDQKGEFNLDQAFFHLNAKANRLPATFVGALFKQTDLSPLIGNSIKADVVADIAIPTKNGVVKFNLQSDHLNGSADLTFDHGIFLNDKTKPADLMLTLTPQGYNALRKQVAPNSSDISLSKPAQVSLKIKSLHMPWEKATEKSSHFWNSAVDADLLIDTLVAVDNVTLEKVTLKDIRASLSSQDISKKITFEVHGKDQTTTASAGSMALIGALDNGLTEKGLVNKRGLTLHLNGHTSKLPVTLICELACLDPKICQKLKATIGSTLDATIKADLEKMSGPFYMELKGPSGNVTLDAKLTNGTLTLNKDFTAELTATPELGKHVLQDVIPFLSGMIGSDQPLKLTVVKDGFSLPLRQYAIENLSIGSATLELGKVRFSNEGQIAKVLSLLTTATANEIIVWLTPTYFSLSNGLFSLERVDMLVSERYPIAAWGKVDMPRDSVSMVIGLSGAAIRRAFNVPGVKKGFFLQLPFRGTMKSASIDKSKAIARLSALVAQSQGGSPGLLIGTALDIATGGLSEPAVPAPTTTPLPWSNLMEEPANQSDKDKNPINQIEKIIPFEEIGKGAGELLKKLFK